MDGVIALDSGDAVRRPAWKPPTTSTAAATTASKEF